MYVAMNKKETNFDNLNEIYNRIREIFSNVKPQKEMSIEELIQLYSRDETFLKDLQYIDESLSEITNILAPIDILEKEFLNFLSIKRMIDYLLNDIKLFIVYLFFIDDLLMNFFNLIHQKLQKADKDYQKEYDLFVSYLNDKKEFFYTQIYEYSGEFEKTVIEINNLLW